MLNTPIIIINFVILARLQVSRSTSYCFRSVPPSTEPRGRNSSCRPDVQYLCHSHPPARDEWQTVPRAGRCRGSRYWGLCSFFLPDKTVNFWSSSTRLRLSSDTVSSVERPRDTIFFPPLFRPSARRRCEATHLEAQVLVKSIFTGAMLSPIEQQQQLASAKVSTFVLRVMTTRT